MNLGTDSETTTDHRSRGARTMLRAAAVPLLAALGVFATSCGDDAKTIAIAGAQVTPGVTATAEASPTASAYQPSRMLPVTPVSIDYEIADAAFEALPGARAIFGQYDGGGYQIEVPDAWNGDVVYFAHGFRGNPPELTVGPPPMREHFIANGYAWAASSYSKNGYEPGAGARDTFALQDVFAEQAGTPKRSYIYGQSMGGHVVTFSLEQYPDAYDGALTECGVVSGHEILDYFLSWGTLAGYFSDVDLDGITTDAPRFAVKIQEDILPALGDVNEPTAAGRAFADVVENMTGGPRPFFREGFDANYNFNFVILVNAVGTAGPANAASQNVDTQYTIDDGLMVTTDQLNAEVARIAANASFRDRAAYPEFAEMTGAIRTPLLTLHGTGDLFVPISLEQSYRRIVEDAGNGDLLVQRAIRRAGHCAFSDEERIRAFDDLTAWVEGGAKPAGDDISGDLSDIGRAFTTPLEDDDPGTIARP